MFEKTNKEELVASAIALIEGEKNQVANLANLSALIFETLPQLNWAGFYLWSEEDGELVLGPFQGRPACIRIDPSRGVCGKAYRTQSIQIIDDVRCVEGHIACDIQTQSELVIPLMREEKCLGVLDLDSPIKGRFMKEDALLLEELVQKIIPHLFG